jgi:hypothetical protein
MTLCGRHFYVFWSTHRRQCDYDAEDGKCPDVAARTFRYCARHIHRTCGASAPALDTGDMSQDEEDDGVPPPGWEVDADVGVAADAPVGGSQHAAEARVERVPRSRAGREAKREETVAAVPATTPPRIAADTGDDAGTAAQAKPEASPDELEAIARAEEVCSGIVPFEPHELQRPYAVSPQLPVNVADAYRARFAERLSSGVVGAQFARPAIPDVLAGHDVDSLRRRPFVALDAPIADLHVDPTDGQIYVRWRIVPSASSSAPGHMLLTLEESAARYPQILIDFLLASTVFV